MGRVFYPETASVVKRNLISGNKSSYSATYSSQDAATNPLLSILSNKPTYTLALIHP